MISLIELLSTAAQLAYIVLVLPWLVWVLTKDLTLPEGEDAWEWYCKNIW